MKCAKTDKDNAQPGGQSRFIDIVIAPKAPVRPCPVLILNSTLIIMMKKLKAVVALLQPSVRPNLQHHFAL